MKRDEEKISELAEISPLIAGIEAQPTLEAPNGYFNELPNNILSKLKSLDEESATSVILEKAGKANFFTTPKGYFENLNDRVLLKIKDSKSSSRIISMPLLKWAVAACVFGLIGYSVYHTFFFKEIENDNEWQESYKLSKLIIQKNEFDISLNQLEDNTIVDFLQENGHDVNAALLASITETDKINEVNEYFCDDENLGLMMNDLSITEKQ